MITSNDLTQMGYANINAFFTQMIDKRQANDFDNFMADVNSLSKKQKKAFVDFCEEMEENEHWNYGDYAAAVESAKNIVYNSI